jgi:hypothetical protein
LVPRAFKFGYPQVNATEYHWMQTKYGHHVTTPGSGCYQIVTILPLGGTPSGLPAVS